MLAVKLAYNPPKGNYILVHNNQLEENRLAHHYSDSDEQELVRIIGLLVLHGS